MKVKDYFLSKEEFDLSPTNIDGILRTFPIPQNIGKYYESENYISHHQDSKSLKQSAYRFAQNINLNYKKNILLTEVPLESTVLDYGCGAGEFLKYIEKDFKTVGYEPNAKALQATLKKTARTKIIEDIDILTHESIDAITLWHVFEHIDNQEDILNKFYNLLKTNGKLIIAVPNHTSFDAKYYKKFWAAYDVPRHIYHFSKSGMQKLFNNEKWSLKKIKSLLLDSYYISILSEKYKGNPFFWLKGPVIGAISNFKASKTGEFSSLIYIIEKK